MFSVSSSAVLATVIVGAVLARLWTKSYHHHGLPSTPPGPRRRWLIGNLLDFPTVTPWKTFRKWNDEFGDLVLLDLPVQPIVILGSLKAATDLLDNRSHIYSDRPQSVMMELLSWKWAFSTMPYGQEWRTCRRYFHDHFSQSAIRHYHRTQLNETRYLLTRILERPELARQHIRGLPGSTIIRVVYGARDPAQRDEYVDLAEQALDSARKATIPGAFLAELLPVLKYVPGWLPGGNARRFGDLYRHSVELMRDKPFDEVKAAMDAGTAIPSVAYNIIRQMQEESGRDLTKDQDTTARNVAGVAYAGAADTTTASAESFILAMALYPEVQRKAQAELDRVVGPSRLPDFSDLESLTYIRAVIMEVTRWMPAVPLSIAHSLTADDEYEGYFIPKGAIVIPNTWAMLHDADRYPEPEEFKPERFINSNGGIDTSVRDPTTIAFGFGRRICPGSDFALSMLSIEVASILHVFEIKPGFDESGQPVILSAEAGSESISSPLTFPRHIKPRSPEAEHLIRDIVLDFDA